MFQEGNRFLLTS